MENTQVDNVVVDSPTSNSLSDAIHKLYEDSAKPEQVSEAPKTPEAEIATDEVADADADADVVVSEESEEDVAEEEEALPDLEIPKNMPKELQEALGKLEDLEVKQATVDIFKKMHNSFVKKNQEFSEHKKLAESINDSFEQAGYKGDSKAKTALVKNFIYFNELINTQPQEAVKKLLAYTKVKAEDLDITSPTDTSSDEEEYLTQTEKQLRNEIKKLNEQVQSLYRRDEEAVINESANKVLQFINATDDKGELLHPHFDEVKEDMKALADINPKLTIEELYKKAVRANDSLFDKILQTEKEKAITERESLRKQQIEKAKKLNKQSRGVSSLSTTTTDKRAIMLELARQAGFN